MFFKSDLMIYNRHNFLWLLLFMFGLISNQSDARAVNISNTWTLPHDGFTVFYRFFRDQISWFEADAVCQFHHANLVTVTNSVEFDASREFLRILDVSEPVWIGLMRSQNSDRFFWSNSKALGFTNEYWAESLPVIDAPLCAVIDPIRDYRWHALRCGGPETASFLCEMNVPSWAEECVIRDIPSLTIQYMADSGTVEITKYCGNDEDIIHQICRGKQDLGRITRRLVCKNEKRQQEISQNFNNQRKNLILNSDILDSRKKSIEIIKNAQTDNKEDNNISIMNNKEFYPIQEKLAEKETENPVQKLIEQFNVEELMQADQPQREESKQEKNLILPHIIITSTKDTKKSSKNQSKKLKLGEKNTNKKFSYGGQKKKLRGKNIAIEDIMMGDQPFIPFSEIDNLNEIQELLPHSKKMLPQDLRHEDHSFAKEKSLNKTVKDNQSPTEHSDISLQTARSAISEPTASLTYSETVNDETITITTGASPISITSELSREDIASIFKSNVNSTNETYLSILKSESERVTLSSLNANSDSESTTIVTPLHSSDTTISSSDTKLTSAVTIGHPMHPQQPRSNVISEEIVHQHIKESNDNHFIPPMLMVKSHYQSPKSGFGHTPEHQLDLQIVRKKISPIDSNDDISLHLDKVSTDFPATTQWDGIIEIQNNHQKLKSDNVSLSGKIHPGVQNIYSTIFNESEQMTNNISALTTRAIKSTSSEETKVSDNNKLKLEVSPTAAIAPNQKIEIKLSNFSTENPTTISSSFMPAKDFTEESSQIKKPFSEPHKILTPSSSISLPMESNDKIKDSIEIDTKTMNSTNLSNIKILSVYPLLFVNKSTDANLKDDFSTILTTIVGKPSSIITFSDETFEKNENKLLTNNTKIVPDSESKTLTTEERNNLKIVASFSKSNQEYQGNMRNYINNNKNNNGEEKEHSHEVLNQSTATAEKGLVSDKEAIFIEKDVLENVSKPLSSSFVILTTTVSSATPISLAMEEELEVSHDGTKKSTTASDTYTSDEENFQPHKPNRRRTLTKPETTSYLKKILG